LFREYEAIFQARRPQPQATPPHPPDYKNPGARGTHGVVEFTAAAQKRIHRGNFKAHSSYYKLESSTRSFKMWQRLKMAAINATGNHNYNGDAAIIVVVMQ
jgi:hypothetical protein